MTESRENLLGGRYRINQILATRNFFTTYLVQDTFENDSLCIVKKLAPNISQRQVVKRLLQREADILQILQQQDQIPGYLNYFDSGDECCLVEEYIRGKSLDKLLDRKWSKPEVVIFLRQLLAVLDFIHKQRIIHRDINPSNIIKRDKDEKYVLIDFGAVKQLDSDYSFSQHLPPQTVIGTPGYAPPEQMSGRGTFHSDIYGLGMTAIHLLTGIDPRDIKRDERGELVDMNHRSIWTKELKIEKDDWLARILTRMVYSRPEQRYPTVEDVIKNLNKTQISAPDTLPPRYTQLNIHVSSFIQRFASSKYIFLALATVTSVLLAVEFIFHPFLRPWYYFQQGISYLDKRDPEAALSQFDELIKLQRNSVQGWKGRGDALFIQGGRDRSALAAYDTALKNQPNNQKILINRGKILYRLGEHREALSTYEKVLTLNPNESEAWSGKGLAHLGLRQFQDASNSFEKLKQLKPDQPRIWQEIGYAVEASQGRDFAKPYFQEALSGYKDNLSSNKKNPTIWNDKGSVLLKLERYDEALKCYEEALKIDKNSYEALVGKGNVLNLQKKYLEALSAYDQAAKVRPDDYQIWLNRGILLTQALGRNDEALNSLDTAIKLRPNNFDAWLYKGLVLFSTNKFQEALVALDKAKEINPQNPDVWGMRSEVLKALNRNEEARISLEESKKLTGTPTPQPKAQ
ncbi:serine/threonine-protein kinase [Calothrix sp. 336/3]|uniref:serine/threonine-protein kinase n=1 Tax=Calothrix sp. 336/3 TaxID=1337936 RepID=UPI0004E449AA|nr:serine/threonine-protein kinase [Calothrix sp. 336/3]AKG23196.1 hypothetical protein IJ00_19670 [Calothrix sp. 336/3]